MALTLANGSPAAVAAKAYCDFEAVDGGLVRCSVCGFETAQTKGRPVRVCGAVAALSRPSRSRRGDTDLEYLAKLLEPCNCPTARIEQRDQAAKYLGSWPVPAVLDNGTWAVGVTTAPRGRASIATTLRTLNINGWKPTVYSEPGSPDVGSADCVVESNAIKFGAWGNWRNAALRCLATGAENVLVVQDDTWVMPGTRLFLERMQWPQDAAFVSLYVASHQTPKGSPGVRRVDISSDIYWGAAALAFRRETLIRLLQTDVCRAWRGVGAEATKTRKVGRSDYLVRKDDEVRNIDTAITRAARELKLSAYAITPSASQHVAPESAIWGTPDNPRGDGGKRAAGGVVGDWAAFDGAYKPTGDVEFDAAAEAWGRLVGRPSYPIAYGLWQELRGLVGPGTRVLEFGSGLSSRLLRSTGADVTSIEQNALIAAASGATYSPLDGDWYSWTPSGQFDLILIDGPANKGRDGVLRHLGTLLAPGGVVIVDDAHRAAEKALANAIGSAEFRTEGGRGWAVVRP